ncbi:MAG: hypothetical protein ACFE8L_10950 [Candidatus Hodarchaeota archaeon]
MTESKKLNIPVLKENKNQNLDNLLNNNVKNGSGKTIIKISTYSYGSMGKRWHILSKLNKEE